MRNHVVSPGPAGRDHEIYPDGMSETAGTSVFDGRGANSRAVLRGGGTTLRGIAPRAPHRP